MATVNIKTQRIVGTALIKATKAFTIFATAGLDMFFALIIAKTNPMIAPKIVDSTPRQNVTRRPFIAVGKVIYFNRG
jgi:hypothetical protein